jgi:hypothetical protein
MLLMRIFLKKHLNKKLFCLQTYLRLDNAGENKLLKKQCESSMWKLGIKFKFTARDTLQQNSLAKVGFVTTANQGQAMMARANVPMKVQYQIYSEAFKTATLLNGLVPIELDGVVARRYIHWCGKNPEFVNHLRTFGKAGMVTVKSKMMPKVKDRGVQCMFVGYALNHPRDTYRMWNPKTGGIHESHDVIWLKRMYYSKPKKEDESSLMEIDRVDDEQQASKKAGEGDGNANEEAEAKEPKEPDEAEEEEPNNEEDNDEETEEKESTSVRRSGRVIVPRQRLIKETTSMETQTSNSL